MKKSVRSCTVYNIADLRGNGNTPPPQPAVAAGNKVSKNLNQYSRRNFLSALLTTFSVATASRRSGVHEPFASRYICEALSEGGFESNGLRFSREQKKAA